MTPNARCKIQTVIRSLRVIADSLDAAVHAGTVRAAIQALGEARTVLAMALYSWDRLIVKNAALEIDAHEFQGGN